MRSRHVFVLLFALLAAQASQAGVRFTDLGTAVPPTTLAGYSLAAFNQAPQAAVADFTEVWTIPGSPTGGEVRVARSISKRTLGATWGMWSHNYTGAVYFVPRTSVTLTLPAGTGAFYFYAEPNQFAVYDISAITNSGAASGAIGVNGMGGANGYAFHADAGEQITSITITTSDNFGMAIGEFGIAASVEAPDLPPVPPPVLPPEGSEPDGDELQVIPTLGEWGRLIMVLLLGGFGVLVLGRRRSAS